MYLIESHLVQMQRRQLLRRLQHHALCSITNLNRFLSDCLPRRRTLPPRT